MRLFCSSCDINKEELCDRHGEIFDPERHPPGTEVKAITYSNMQIHEYERVGAGGTREVTNCCDLYVIVDI